MTRRAIATVLAGLTAGCATGAPAPPSPPAPPVATVLEGGRIAVLDEPDASAVSAALVFPGSGWELPGTEGLTLLAAEALLETARADLERLGATARVRCGRAAFTVELVAPLGGGGDALDVLLRALFHPRPTATALDAARVRLASILSLDHANPAWQARLAARQALHADTVAPEPWSGPGCGVPELLPRFDLDDVRAGAYRFAPRMARAAVVAPGAAALAERIRARLPASDTPPPLPAPRRTVPGRRYVERNTVTAWSSLAFPFDGTGDVAALRGLAALLEDAFGPAVARPEVFAISHELEEHGAGGTLVVHVVTEPAAASAYAEAIEARVAALAAGDAADAWDRVAARLRGEMLIERERPEARAAAMAMAMALGRNPGGGWPESAPTAERVRRAAASLGPPARSIVGPRAARPAAP